VQDRDAGTKITATNHDTHDQDLSDGIDATINKDGSNAFTGDADLGSNKLTSVADATAHADGVNMGQVQDGAGVYVASDTGAADAYAIAPSPAVTAYAAGQHFSFKAANASTGASTLNVSGLGTKAIQVNGNALTGAEIGANDIIEVRYDGTQFQMVSPSGISPQTQGDVLDDLNALGASSADGEIIVATGAGAFAYESGATARTSLGLTIGTDVLAEGDTPIGKHTIAIPANAMSATTSNGATKTTVETTAGRPDIIAFDFDASADEAIQVQVPMPKSYNLGTVTAQFFWESTAADTDGVTWAIQGVAITDNETIDTAYGTAITVDDANQGAAEELLVSAESGAITIGGTPADDDMCFFRVFRDVSDANDTATEDARLLGIKLFITTDAGNDT
jgi:hypothetical protein